MRSSREGQLQEGLEFEARAREFMFLWPPAQDVASSSELGSIWIASSEHGWRSVAQTGSGVGVGREEQGSSNSLPGSNLCPTICWLWDLGEFLSLSGLRYR